MRGLICVFLSFSCTLLIAQSSLSFLANEVYEKKLLTPEEKDQRGMKTVLDKMAFDLVGGLIYVDAELGGVAGQYILDTGAPTLILNSKQYQNSKKISYVATFADQVPIVIKTVKSFQVGSLHKKRMLAYYTDISHLETIKKRPVKGLIGVDVFRSQEVLFDYDRKEMVVLPTKRRVKQIADYQEIHAVKFRKQGHLPVIRVKIGKRNFYFGIDTGAEVNIISKRLKKYIKAENIIWSDQPKFIRGIDQQSKIAEEATIKEFSLKGMKVKNMDFVFADISNINQSYEMCLDGILGYPFLSSEIFSINFRKNKLYVWEKQQTFQYDAAVKEIVMSESEVK